MTNEQTDWRALCAELTDWLSLMDDPPHELVVRAQAALAQPEPQDGLASDGGYEAGSMWCYGTRPAPEPEDDEIDDEAAVVIPLLLEEAALAANSDAPYAAGKLTLAAQLLGERRPTIKPVPVAERLPGPEDCDAEGRCWWFNPGVKASSNPHIALSSWRLTHMLASKPMGTHWLPHHALPIPQFH